MSLAALLGIDARVMLTTDDPATHVVYDRIIDQASKWADVRASNHAREHAYETIKALAEATSKKKASG